MPWNAISAFVLDQIFGYQTANKLRENAIALASAKLVHELGGSRLFGMKTAAYADVPDWRDVVIDGTNLGGFTKVARVQRRTSNVATSVQAKIRNITDGTDAGVGVAYSADTNWNEETITLTLAAGIKTYRLQHIGGNATNDIFSIGRIEIFATA